MISVLYARLVVRKHHLPRYVRFIGDELDRKVRSEGLPEIFIECSKGIRARSPNLFADALQNT